MVTEQPEAGSVQDQEDVGRAIEGRKRSAAARGGLDDPRRQAERPADGDDLRTAALEIPRA
jgi:hypothetical protein